MKRIFVLAMLLATLVCASQAAAVSSRDLVQVADFSNPVVSPDGSRVAFRIEQASIERNTYDTVWYVQKLDGTSPPLRVADGGVPLRDSAGISVSVPAVWSPDGRWIYYRALINGRIDVWRAATDGSNATSVTADQADVRDFSLSPDGKELKYSVGATREQVTCAEQAEYDRGIHIDESTPIGQNLFRSGYIEGRLATQRLDFWFDRVALLANVPDRWKAIDLVTGARHDLAASDIPPKPLAVSDIPKQLPEPWKVARDPRTGRIALLTRVGDATGLDEKPSVELSMLPDSSGRKLVKCSAALCTDRPITDIQWRPNSNDVLFTVTDPGQGLAQSIFRWNVATGAVHLVATSQGLLNGGERFGQNNAGAFCGVSSTTLVCVAADSDHAPWLERIDLDTGSRQVLFEPNAALTKEMSIGKPARLLRWTDANGQSFMGQFYSARRTGNGLPPLFVTYYYCRGFVRGGMGDEWPLAALAERGISALCINAVPYRTQAVERYELGRSAVASAIELLAAKGEIDRTKVGMGGLSFGTEVTLWTLIHSNLLAAASVSSVGISQQYYLIGSMKGEAFFSGLHKYWQLGTPSDTPEQWQKISPALNLGKIRAPLLMQVPEQEFIQTLDYAIPMMRDHRADVYVFPHEPHQKFQPKHKLAVYERNMDWFRFWLLGAQDPDPSKVEQYAHWRLMQQSISAVQSGKPDHGGS
jgi:dipeptidyl aminopeptidase/acylaminoacyl peptidase